MAAVGILLVGIGGWLMYEAYKGRSISDIKGILQGTLKTAANPTTTAAAPPVRNALD